MELTRAAGACAFIWITACSSGSPAGPADDNGDGPATDTSWSAPVTLFASNGRITGGTHLYAIGRPSGQSTLATRVSLDEGVTWSAPTPIPGVTTTILYRTFVADGTTLYLLHEGADGHMHFVRSDNGGVTWTNGVRLSQTNQEKPHRSSMAVQGGTVHVVNGREFNAPVREVFYWRSTNDGDSFAPTLVLATETDGAPEDADVAAEGNNVHIVYWLRDRKQTIYRRSTNRGATWEAPKIIATGERNRTRVAVQNGILVVSIEGPISGQEREVEVIRSLDNGTTWGQLFEATSTPGLNANHPQIIRGTNGRFHIFFSLGAGASASDHDASHVQSADFGATWNSPETVTSRAVASQPFSAFATAGYVHVLSGPANVANSPSPAVYARRRTPN